MKYYPYVGGRHPVLEDGTLVKLEGGRATLEGAEGNTPPAAVPAARRKIAVSSSSSSSCSASSSSEFRTEGFLFVRLLGDASRNLPKDTSALPRVELERRPRLSVIAALEDRHRIVNGGRAELETDVRHFELLSEAERQRGVAVRQGRERFRQPAAPVRRIVQVRQKASRMMESLIRNVTELDGTTGYPAVFRPLSDPIATVGRREVRPRVIAGGFRAELTGQSVGRVSAGAGGRDRLAESGVDKRRKTAARFVVVVRARVADASG